MTAVLAAIARLVLTAIAGAVLVLACVAAMIWAQYGPQGAWTLAWLAVVCAVVWGAVEAWERLRKRSAGRSRHEQ